MKLMEFLTSLSFLSLFALCCQNGNEDPYKAMDDYYSQLKISTENVEIEFSDSTNLKALFSGFRDNTAGFDFFLIQPPNIAPMLNKELLLKGKAIPVEINSIANKRGAVATCVDNQPKIFLPQKNDKRISPYALVFFRFHEYAHHKLGHTACTRGVNLTSKEEIMADCFAADILEHEFGQDGISIVHHMAGTLNGINESANGHYPSSLTRARLLYSMRECEERVQKQQ